MAGLVLPETVQVLLMATGLLLVIPALASALHQYRRRHGVLFRPAPPALPPVAAEVTALREELATTQGRLADLEQRATQLTQLERPAISTPALAPRLNSSEPH